ncbi:Uu.00g053980.m01.CDS01 [Anthostomella pinea]|uniref:Uu.00g053980.m01.CDS01 n=1 Tax=Anthostomella pinea TaxID=933095 RepID=A0AAI8VWK6_9PEZI|nr:Uu.00g053980.m01.CDS01 [Anthostomella pinea]
MAASSQRTSETAVQSPTAMSDDLEQANGPKPSSGPAPAPAPPPGQDAEKNYQPKTLKFWSILVSIFLALFLVALDRTIIGTASPTITQEFHSLGDIGWYGSAYQLTTAASQLLFGRVYKFYNVKRTFLVSLALFEIGSVVCGAAPNSIVFIVGRAIAGLGGAGIFSGVQIIMIPMIPLRKRAMFQGIFGTVFGLASVLGPLVGGAFTESVSWRWCFYVNLPIGAVAALCLIVILRTPPKKGPPVPATIWDQIVRLDPLGTFFFIPSIVCLLIALQWGGSTYAWSSWRIILLLVLFPVLFIAFAAVQVLMPKTATVPVRIIRRRSILAAAIYMFAIAGSFLLAIYFLPLWFQVVQGATAAQSGIYTIPFVLSLVVGSILSGGVTTRIGYYVPAMILSPSLLAVGQGLMSTLRVGEVSSHWIGYQVVGGLGLGIGMQAATLAAQAVLPLPDIPTGIAIMFFAQQLGGGIFTSVGQNLLSTYMVSHLRDVPGVDASQVTSEGAVDLVNNVAPEYRLAVKEVYNQAIARIFLCAMGVALAAVLAGLCMEWKNIKKTGPPGAGPPGAKPSGPSDKGADTSPPETTKTPESGDEDPSAASRKVPLGKSNTSAEPTKRNGSLQESKDYHGPAEKSGCDHCEHCRLSRAINLAPSEQTSRPSRGTVTTPSSSSPAPPPGALEEAARLAGIARDAVAQLEELTRPYSALGTMGSSGRLSAEPIRENARHQPMAAPEVPGRDHRRGGSFVRRLTTQELLQNANRVSAQLEKEERESNESLHQTRLQQSADSKLSTHYPSPSQGSSTSRKGDQT